MNEMTQSTMDPVVDGVVRMELKPERIQLMLGRLPGWALRQDGRAIVRTRLFTTPEAAYAFIRNACWLGAKLKQPMTVRLAGTEATVVLPGHPVRGCTGGLTDAVFNLAELIG